MEMMTIERIEEGLKKGGFVMKVSNKHDEISKHVRDGVNVELTLKINMELKKLAELNKANNKVEVIKTEDIILPPNVKIAH